MPVVFGLFGKNANFSTLLDLVKLQVSKNPDDFLQIRNKNLVKVISEKLTIGDSEKLFYKSIFKRLKNSDEDTFDAFMNFVWYSSMPCYDVENFTAGV